MEVRANLRGIFLTVVLCALALASATCSGGSHRVAPAIQPATADSLDDALDELDALDTPEGVDAALFAQLKGALAEALVDNFPGRRGAETPPYKITSSPPTGNTNRIEDLACSLDDDSEYVLSWLYRNCGDYNQNGAVGIEDITPLAIHFNEDAATENEWIDGDSDGRVHISDITPIAMYFGANVHHYSIQGSHFFSSQFAEVAQLVFPESTPNDARFAFEQSLGAEPEYLYWRIVPVDDEGNPGDASNTAQVSAAPPPAVRILSINPLGGVTGTEVTFNALVTGEAPFDYEWSFGGGATPNESTEASPTVTLGAVDAYDASLSVENADGSAVKHFTLTVTEESGEPPQIIAVSPTEGDSGTEVTFTAEVTGDGPFTYYWDFGGGASPNQSSGVSDQPSATVTLSRGGTLPEPVATYPASLTVTNSSGTAIHDFNLSISAWWHLIEIPFEHVHAYALTPDGKPALLRGTETEVVYCVWNSGYWEEEVIPRATYKVLAHHPLTSEPVAVGSAGGETSGTVVYSWRSGAQWYQEEIEYAGWVAGIDLAFHQDGSPVVCWGILGDPFALKVAERTPEDWMIETVPTEGQDPRQPVLAVGGEDNIAVVYGNSETPGGVWIARKQATTWEISEAIPEPSSGQEMATAPDGALVLVVRRSFAHTTYITYAEETPSGWNLEDIDTSDYYYVNTVAPSFLADGEPVIAYGVNIGEQDEPVYEVRVVWRDTEAWNLSVPFPPEGNTSSWGGSLIGVSMDGTVALTVGEHDTSSNYYALFW